jgi:putative membrane protein
MEASEIKQDVVLEEKPERGIRDYIGLSLRGMAMGASDIVPGVSGGTMALILGIYEELIFSIRAIGRPALWRAAVRFRIKEVFQLINWQFLLAVGLGIFLAILVLARPLEWMLVNQPVYLWSFFFGLVVASAYTVSKRIPKWNAKLIVTLIVGTAVAFIIVGLVPAQTPDTWWFLILSGALASCAMILPGLSGAFILFILGKYATVLSAVNNRDIITIGLIGIGAAFGLVTFAQILSWLFKKHHDYTLAVLIGLMLGSLRKLWAWKQDIAWLVDEAGEFILDSHGEIQVIKQINVLPDISTAAGISETGLAIGLAILGAALVLTIEWYARKKEKVEAVAVES